MKRWNRAIFFLLGTSGAMLSAVTSLALPVPAAYEFDEEDSFFSEIQPLLQVVSDPEEGRTHSMLVGVDDKHNLLALIRRSSSDEQTISYKDLFHKDTSLARASGHDAIFVGCRNGTPEVGCRINIRYLYDGMWGTFKDMEGELRKNASTGRWELRTLDGILVRRLTLRSRTFMGQLIGVDRIDVN